MYFLLELKLRLVVVENVKFLPNPGHFLHSLHTRLKYFIKQPLGVVLIIVLSPNQIIAFFGYNYYQNIEPNTTTTEMGIFYYFWQVCESVSDQVYTAFLHQTDLDFVSTVYLLNQKQLPAEY